MKKKFLSEINEEAYLEIYAEPTEELKPAVLIYPGGGYYVLGESEKMPIVNFYKEHGFQTFVINYSIGEKASFPNPLIEGSKAVWEIRKNAKEYGVNPDQITLVGFSAGAHAATMLATLWNDDISREGTDIPFGGNKPNATVTGYTPTTFEDFYDKPVEVIKAAAGGGTIDGPINLLNSESNRFNQFSSLTSHNFINEETPPAFLWKTTADFPADSMAYAAGLANYGIDYELHIFNDSSRCAALEFDKEYALNYTDRFEKNTQKWAEMSINWLHRIYKINTK